MYRSDLIKCYRLMLGNKFLLIIFVIALIGLLEIYIHGAIKNVVSEDISIKDYNNENIFVNSYYNESSSVVDYKDENVFIKINNSPNCGRVHSIGLSNKYINVSECKNHTLCKLYNHSPIRYVHPKIICNDFIKCVTASIKTRKRDVKLVNLIKSAWKYYPGLRFAIADDSRIGEKMNSEFLSLLEKKDLIQYTQIAENSGVALGRNMAILMAKTPYVLLMDDDFVFESTTKFDSAFNLLISTDLSVVAGIVSNCDYPGVLKVNLNNNSARIEQIYNTVYYSIPKFDNCFKVDVVENFFLAKKMDLLGIGGYTNILKNVEHEDFFIKLRMAGKNVAVCPNVYIKHDVAWDEARDIRYKNWRKYSALFNKQWNITSFNICHTKDMDKLSCYVKA